MDQDEIGSIGARAANARLLLAALGIFEGVAAAGDDDDDELECFVEDECGAEWDEDEETLE